MKNEEPCADTNAHFKHDSIQLKLGGGGVRAFFPGKKAAKKPVADAA